MKWLNRLLNVMSALVTLCYIVTMYRIFALYQKVGWQESLFRFTAWQAVLAQTFIARQLLLKGQQLPASEAHKPDQPEGA